MSRTLFAKIWDAHVVAELGGEAALIAVDRIFLHERTGAAALKSLAEAGRAVADPARVFAVMDHIVDTRPGRGDGTLMAGGEGFITETRAACHDAGITLFDVNDPDQGITHVISPELGIVLPGCTLIAPDSGRDGTPVKGLSLVRELGPVITALVVMPICTGFCATTLWHRWRGLRHSMISFKNGVRLVRH